MLCVAVLVLAAALLEGGEADEFSDFETWAAAAPESPRLALLGVRLSDAPEGPALAALGGARAPLPAAGQRSLALDAGPGLGADRFREGYVSMGGDPALAERFLERVLPCESPDGRGGIDWTPGNAEYRTAAQFHPATMATIEAALGPLRYEDPYDVGRAAAWWVARIGEQNAGTTAGWPVCWWR